MCHQFRNVCEYRPVFYIYERMLTKSMDATNCLRFIAAVCILFFKFVFYGSSSYLMSVRITTSQCCTNNEVT